MAVLSSRQSGTATIGPDGDAFVEVTVSSYDPTKSILLFTYRTPGTGQIDTYSIAGWKVDGTTIRFQRRVNRDTQATIEWELLEFASGVTVQDLELVLDDTGASGADIACSAVDQDHAFIISGGQFLTAFISDRNDVSAWEFHLSSSTNVRGDAIGTLTDTTFKLQVVEIDDADVQEVRGTDLEDSGWTLTIPTTVDPTKSLLFITGQRSASAEPLLTQAENHRTWIADGDTIQSEAYRNETGSTWDVTAYVVETTDGTSVESGLTTFGVDDLTIDETISSTTESESSSNLIGFPMVSCGSADALWAWPEEGLATASLTSATNARIQRATGDSDDVEALVSWQVVIWNTSGGGGADYTLTAEQGSVSVTGQDAGLSASRLLAAESGEFSVSGQDAALSRAYTIVADNGSFSTTGQDAGLLASRLLVAEQSSVSLTGQDAALLATRTIAADFGSFAATGQDADLLASRVVTAEQGAFSITGQDAGLVASRLLTAERGSFSVDGQDADLQTSGPTSYTLTAESAAFAIAGQDAGLVASRLIVAEQGTFSTTGQDAILAATRRLDAAAGSFTSAGQDASLVVGYVLAAEPGLFDVAGQDATIARILTLIAESGSYSVTGQDVEFARARVLLAAPGAFAIVGQDAALTYSPLVVQATPVAVTVSASEDATVPDVSTSIDAIATHTASEDATTS